MTCTDQNAFGLMVGFFDIEDAEYTLEPETFVTRFEQFRALALEHARSEPVASGTSALDLGHALYFEFEDGDQSSDPMLWLRGLARRLVDQGFAVVAVLTHGGRWVEDSNDLAAPDPEPSLPVVRASRPSEALRRALYADAAAHGAEGNDGWGTGVFVDEEAVAALGRTFKNAPTQLHAGGATFFRIGA
jgi:hypothetical protein